MAWPDRVYVATAALGIFYTDAFTATGDQPVWGTINGGLPATTITAFCLDRHEVPANTRMFCIVSGTIYRRTTGDWAAVLTSAEANTLAGFSSGQTLSSVIVDSETGYVYGLLRVENATAPIGVVRSIDHGTTWTAVTARASAFNYALGNIDAHDGLVVFTTVPSAAIKCYAYYSRDNGSTWAYHYVGEHLSAYNLPVLIHRQLTETWYGGHATSANLFDLFKATPAGYTILSTSEGYGPYAAGGLWIDPDDDDHMLVLNDSLDSYARETSDDWTSLDAENATNPQHINVLGEDCENDAWVTGRINDANGPYVYVTTDGYTMTHRSGANYNSSPYADSIPETADGVISRGLWVVFDAANEGPTPPPGGGTITPPDTGTPITVGGGGYVQAVTMPDYTGYERGEPLPGDRGAWAVDTEARGQLHASDIRQEASRYHLPVWDAQVGDAPVWDGSLWAPTDVATQDELDNLALNDLADVDADAPDDGDALVYNSVDGEWEPVDVLTPTEHTAIGDSSPHHAAVTLGAGNDAALALSGQELTLTLSGYSGELLMQDGVTAPPVPIETEDQTDWLYED